MKKFCILLMVSVLAGCVTTGQSTVKSLTRINHVTTGMTQQQVQSIMGAKAVVGYVIADSNTGATEPITVDNPQRSQTIHKNGRVFEAVFYFTHIRKPDDRISDDELTPFIFEDNRLIGKGWYRFEKITGR